ADPPQRFAVQLHDSADGIERSRIVDPRKQLVDGRDELPDLRVLHQWTPPNIGWCTFLSVRPLPRYMCTPQGRHGSKLRTARMMSMPLKLSGPFSSKIGVFCTASSYGPGVPKTSRGFAFQGVGGYGW